MVGPYTFDDLAFADDATQIAAGTLSFFGTASNIDHALTGYSPTRFVVNLGNPTFSTANQLQLDFTDLMAVNDAGADIVLFDARFSSDSYEIAVRESGSGVFSSFQLYQDTTFVNTGVSGPLGISTLFGIEIDLDDFGLVAGTIVDAIQFKAAIGGFGALDADPVMAAVLNGTTGAVPAPAALLLLATGLAALGGLRRGRGSGAVA